MTTREIIHAISLMTHQEMEDWKRAGMWFTADGSPAFIARWQARSEQADETLVTAHDDRMHEYCYREDER